MTRKKRKYNINEGSAKRFLEKAYSFRVRKMNFYQFRIYHEEFDGFFDWYHTQGTLCVSRDRDFLCKLNPTGNKEVVAELINEYVYK